MVQIIDLTTVLNTRKENEVILNPSIIKLNYDNDFLISYRYIGYEKKEKHKHPWVGRDKDDTWIIKYGGTAFAKCKILLDMSNKFNIEHIKHFDSRFENAEDARLFKRSTKDDYNIIYITYNITGLFDNLPEELQNYYRDKGQCNGTFNYQTKKPIDISTECNEDKFECGYMVICKCTLDNDTFNLEKNYLICPKCIHQKTEKNWSLWESNDENLRISYDIVGTHKYLIAKTDDFQDCNMISSPNKMNIYENPPSAAVELHDLTAGTSVSCSLSTPAVDFDDNIMLAVGHAKILHGNKMKLEFTRIKDINFNMHPHYHYFMFFYTFNKITGELLKVSQLFTPYDNEPYSLVFASGLCKFNEDNFIVSYGVGDEFCKFAIFSRDEIIGLLNKNKPINRDVKLLYPEKFGGKNLNIRKTKVKNNKTKH